jgi:hypothetical protein
MVIGMRSGGKSLPNVGTLAAYERFGQRLITSDAVPLFPTCASPWRQSGLTINAGDLGAGMAEGALLLTQKTIRDGHLLAYQIDIPDFCRWIRQIYWKPQAYVLIVDRVQVATDEAFTVGLNWRCAGHITDTVNGLATLGFQAKKRGRFYVQVSEGLHLTTETNTYPALGAPRQTPLIKEVMLHATMDASPQDGEVAVATLLHAVVETAAPAYRLNTHDASWVVEGPEETISFSNETGVEEMAICDFSRAPQTGGRQTRRRGLPNKTKRTLETRWRLDLSDKVSTWTQSPDGSAIAVGTIKGEVIVLNEEGKTTWTASCDSRITSLTPFGHDLIAGTQDGQVKRFNNKGTVLWQHDCQFRAERAFWPWWFLNTPTVGALCVGHDPDAGQDIVAIGTGSTSLNFLNAKTGVLLDDVLSPYGLPDRIRAHISADTNQLQFFVGHSYLTCGSTVRAWVPPPQTNEGICFNQSLSAMGRSLDGWASCGVRDFWVGQTSNGAPGQVVVLRHGSVNQLTVYDKTTDDPLWDAGLGGSPVALAVVPGSTGREARFYVAEQFGWLVGFDGTGKRRAAAHIADALEGMYADPSGDLLLWNREALYIFRAGEVERQYRLNAAPLGWFFHLRGGGLVCVQEGQLVMKAITG